MLYRPVSCQEAVCVRPERRPGSGSSPAGFTRGAFYSNFSSKDELAVAMLDDHLAQSEVRNRALLDRHPDPGGFVQALRDDSRHGDDVLHRNPLLQVELMLYVARTPELRPSLGHHLRTMRGLGAHPAAHTIDLDADGEIINLS